MSELPEGWESDYDGSRWFFRYKPTGNVQFHFPQPGDEYAEFIDSFAPLPDLTPEERLESDRQVKRRATTSENKSTPRARRATREARAGATSGPLGDPGLDDGG